MAAARQERDDRLRGVEMMARTEIIPAGGYSHAIEQRMADVIDIDTVAFVIIFLERQDDEHSLDVALDRVDAITAPRPDLRADVIDHAPLVALQLFRQSQIELGPVDQNHQRR